MIDYDRMKRHIRYNKIARVVSIACVVLMVDEVYLAIKDNFPVWDDIATPLTYVMQQGAAFIERHTRMYRIDE